MTVIVVKVTESSLENLCLACPHLRGFIKNDIMSAFVMKLTACLLWFLRNVISLGGKLCDVILTAKATYPFICKMGVTIVHLLYHLHTK